MKASSDIKHMLTILKACVNTNFCSEVLKIYGHYFAISEINKKE